MKFPTRGNQGEGDHQHLPKRTIRPEQGKEIDGRLAVNEVAFGVGKNSRIAAFGEIEAAAIL